MELGALVCTARGPRCDRCPLAARCAWVTAGRPEGAARSRRRQPFEGTDRQMRGMIMARLRRDGHATLTELLELDPGDPQRRSEEHTSELQSRGHLVCRLPLR